GRSTGAGNEDDMALARGDGGPAGAAVLHHRPEDAAIDGPLQGQPGSAASCGGVPERARAHVPLADAGGGRAAHRPPGRGAGRGTQRAAAGGAAGGGAAPAPLDAHAARGRARRRRERCCARPLAGRSAPPSGRGGPLPAARGGARRGARDPAARGAGGGEPASRDARGRRPAARALRPGRARRRRAPRARGAPPGGLRAAHPLQRGRRDPPHASVTSPGHGGAAKAAGYATAAFVANDVLSTALGYAQGFDAWSSLPRRPSAELVRAALLWTREHRGPFFVYIHTMGAHRPYEPAPEHWRPFLPASL